MKMVRVIEAIQEPEVLCKRNGKKIVRKKTELGDQTGMPTISLHLHNSHDCDGERYKL